MSAYNPIIIALDTPSPLKALNLVRKLKVTGVAFKIGFELFSAGGPKIVEKIIGHDVRVFLDLKFHDIPNTVSKVSYVATKMGVWMYNMHASGGSEMMKRAKEVSVETASKAKITPPLVVAVTVLTSLNDLSYLNVSQDIPSQVVSLAILTREAGLDGVVASGEEAGIIRERCGPEFCVVTPGIRPNVGSNDDQKRTVTPKEAIDGGSHYLVMGRPILESAKPVQTINSVLTSL
jgi:orotidine-5'-phosphate decarboxylase